MMKTAIIGSGVAALEAAIQIKALKPESEVVMYSREKVRPYRRPALSGMIAEPMNEAQFYIKPETFYQDKGIRLELDHTVTAIQPSEKFLTFADGTAAAFDKLLIATGSRCFLPPVPGIEGENVLSLREFADFERIEKRLEAGVRKIVVIGGGLLGLELAESLLERGCEVVVAEGCPALLPRNLDAEAAAIVEKKLAEVPNLTLRFGVKVQAVEPDGVVLEAGKIPAELVMVSAGARANTALAAAAGIRCNRGIAVDDRMRTSAPDIFAAGDCAEVDGVCYGLFNAAKMMGQAAGRNIAGEEARFRPESYPARLAVFGLKLFSAGCFDTPQAETSYDPETGNFRKLFRDDSGRLAGCILMGDLRESLKLQAEIDSSR